MNQYDYGMRVYDPRIGRFLSVDPLHAHFSDLTPYQFASNRPIEAVDLDGEESKDLYMDMEPNRRAADERWRKGIKLSESRAEKAIRYFITFGLGVFIAPVAMLAAEGVAVGALTSSTAAMNITVNTITWLSNANNLLAASTATGFVFELVNPDPNGTIVDFPGQGDEFGRAVKWLFKNKAGRTVEFAAEKGAKFANESEFSWTGRLLDEGNNVTLLKESTQEGVRSADLLVNGLKTELKEISNIVKTDGDNLSAGIARVIKESSGQANHLIIDLSKQVGATLEVAKRGVARYFGQGSSKETIRIVGQGFDETFHKTDVIKAKK